MGDDSPIDICTKTYNNRKLYGNVHILSVAKKNNYAVITADVVQSRSVEAFRQKRDKKLRELSAIHQQQQLILSPYAVTAWDEFQAILSKPEFLPRIILDLRRYFFPLRLWIAVGVGTVSDAHKKPVNLFAGGESFERARKAADQLKESFSKYPVFTSFESGNPAFDTIANAIYRLHDSLIDKTTAKQWATINAQFKATGQEAAARKLALDASTISRNLKRGYYWQMIETADAVEKIIGSCF
jgi:hypothetical protein